MHGALAFPLRPQVLDLHLLPRDRDFLHSCCGFVLLYGRAVPLIVDLQHELAASHLIAFLHVDRGHPTDFLGRELDLFLVHEAPRRKHRGANGTRLEILDLHLDRRAPAEARLQQRHRHDECDDTQDEQEFLGHRGAFRSTSTEC